MKRFASVRFDAVLGDDERAEAARAFASVGGVLSSWACAAGCSYAAVQHAPESSLEPLRVCARTLGARLDSPALVLLRITPADTRRLDALAAALGGNGRPSGVLEVRPEAAALVVELAPHVSRLGFVVALIDVTLENCAERTIEPLLPLDDETLAAFASDILREPQLDASRLIETYLEAIFAGEPA